MRPLPPGWYAFAATAELSGKKINALRRFGLDLAIWQTQSKQWIAMENVCPHRSARLSLGKIQNDCIVCPFHGIVFSASGVCQYVPELKRAVSGLKVKTYPLIERSDFLWIFWGDKPQQYPNWFEDLDIAPRAYTQTQHLWHTHFSRCVENQLDYAHLPFVHYNSIGRGFDPARKMTWDIDDKHIKGVLEADSSEHSYFEFRFPNIWRLVINKKLTQTLIFVPIDDNKTAIYQRSYNNFTIIKKINKYISWLSIWLNRFILWQDANVVMSQLPQDVRDANQETLFPSDFGVRAFRKWLKHDNA